MSIETFLLLILIIVLAGSFPAWPYSRPWGYGPTGVLIVLLVGFLVWAIAENRPLFKNTEKDVKAAVQDVGQDLKTAGRNVADTVRQAVK
ncbi:MAG: DUF3309 domain-containing protein [Candidatus Omnitrophica bacterium]|nr:DUF3309 domain-containing protein [Candidatus Omnitrophota bacterium]